MDFKLPENTTMIADTARRYLKDNYSFDTYIAQIIEPGRNRLLCRITTTQNHFVCDEHIIKRQTGSTASIEQSISFNVTGVER